MVRQHCAFRAGKGSAQQSARGSNHIAWPLSQLLTLLLPGSVFASVTHPGQAEGRIRGAGAEGNSVWLLIHFSKIITDFMYLNA